MVRTPRIETVYRVTVGEYYLVPCVYGYWSTVLKPRWWVVHGSFHSDAEYLNFPEMHYHLDARFFPGPFRFRSEINAVFGKPIHERPYEPQERRNANLVVQYRRRKCLREMPSVTRGGFSPSLIDAYHGKSLKGDTCPHKGYSMKAIPPDADGCRQCPLHGLKFNAKGVCVG